MKKLIIFLVLFLTSCSANIGDVRHQKLIITDATKPVARKNRTVYIAKSYHSDGPVAAIKFSDDTGKYTVGDTIIIIKKQ